MDWTDGGQSDIPKLQNQVDEVVDIMRDNIVKALERDDKISDLVDRTDALVDEAKQFKDNTVKIKRKYWWKNVKMWLILIAVIVVIIIIIIVSVTTTLKTDDTTHTTQKPATLAMSTIKSK